MSKHHTYQKGGEAFEQGTANSGQAAESAQNPSVQIPINEQREQNCGSEQAEDAVSQTSGTANISDSADKRSETPENSGEELTPQEKIAALEADLAEVHDQLLRKAADFENFRKRMYQEKQNAIDYANQSLLADILPIIDDFERAIQSAEGSQELTGLPAGKAVVDGITMIEKRLVNQLENKWGLKRFNSAGEPFDPNRHEALMMEKSPDVSEPTVQEDLIKGYLLKDRVLRAAKVKVLMPVGSG